MEREYEHKIIMEKMVTVLKKRAGPSREEQIKIPHHISSTKLQ